MLPRKLASASGSGLIALRKLFQPLLLLQPTAIDDVAWVLKRELLAVATGMGVDEVDSGGATTAHTSAGLICALTCFQEDWTARQRG